MSKKKIIIIVLSVLVILLVVFMIFISRRTNQDNTENFLFNKSAVSKPLMTNEEKGEFRLFHLGTYEVLARDNSGKITSYQIIGMQEPKKVTLEWMSDAEKNDLHIAVEMKIQVLARDQNGKVNAYRVVNKDSDIIKEY